MEKVFTIFKTANAMKVTTQTENVPEKESMFTPTEINTSASSKTDGQEGTGTFTWQNGAVYEGEWVKKPAIGQRPL